MRKRSFLAAAAVAASLSLTAFEVKKLVTTVAPAFVAHMEAARNLDAKLSAKK